MFCPPFFEFWKNQNSNRRTAAARDAPKVRKKAPGTLWFRALRRSMHVTAADEPQPGRGSAWLSRRSMEKENRRSSLTVSWPAGAAACIPRCICDHPSGQDYRNLIPVNTWKRVTALGCAIGRSLQFTLHFTLDYALRRTLDCALAPRSRAARESARSGRCPDISLPPHNSAAPAHARHDTRQQVRKAYSAFRRRARSAWRFRGALTKSSTAGGGSFPPILRFEKREIHKVFRRFPSLVLTKNLSPSTAGDFVRTPHNLAQRVYVFSPFQLVACIFAVMTVWFLRSAAFQRGNISIARYCSISF